MGKNKIIIYFFISFVCFLTIANFFLILTLPKEIQAETKIEFKPQIPIKGFTGGKIKETSIGEYIIAIYKYAIGVVGILAAVVMMFGGVRWIMAGGNASAIGEAKAWIGAALTGLLLALGSWMILNTVNPSLVTLQPIKLKKVGDPSALKIISDSTKPCGEYDDANASCGTKCTNNLTCMQVPKNTPGSRECPKTLDGNGTYWLCTMPCCTDNNDSQCPPGQICNMGINTPLCSGKGACTVKQEKNGICGENSDCINNNCNTGFLGTYRCQ